MLWLSEIDSSTTIRLLFFTPSADTFYLRPITVRVIQGDRTSPRRFLQERNRYWSGQFGGGKEGWPDQLTNDHPPQANSAGGSFQGSSIPQPFQQWPPAWPWTPTTSPPLQAPAPAPVAPEQTLQPRPAGPPAHSIALPPFLAALPSDDDVGSSSAAAAARARHSGVVYVFAAAGASLLAAVAVALFVLCYRSSKVVTVRPWATGLSGQLQKAFVTGAVPFSALSFGASYVERL
jgi:hypothetical protein